MSPPFDEILHDPVRKRTLKRALAAERQPSRREQLYWNHLQAALCDTFRRFANSRQGEQPTLRTPLSKVLAEAFESLPQGYVHPLVRPATKRPGQRTWPALRRCQVSALHYIERAKRGDVRDPHPVKTVSLEFGITCRVLHLWKKTLAIDLAAAVSEPCTEADTVLRRAMKNAAASYRYWRGKTRAPAEPTHHRIVLRAMRANRRITQ